jgi:hypothetical protein
VARGRSDASGGQRSRDDGGTTLKLRESGFERPEDRRDNVGGWKHELGELVEYLGEAG